MQYRRLNGWYVLLAEILGTIILIALCVVAANQVRTAAMRREQACTQTLYMMWKQCAKHSTVSCLSTQSYNAVLKSARSQPGNSQTLAAALLCMGLNAHGMS